MKLDDKQKKTLKTFCLYLGSYGTKEGYLGFHFYNDRPEMDWDGWRASNVRVKIDGYEAIDNLAEEITLPIIENYIDYYDTSGDVKFCVNCTNKVIYFESSIREMDINWEGQEWELSDLEELDSWEDLVPQITGYDIGVVSYEGSGDSGYIEDRMVLDGDEQITIPADLETWMYNQLENYGGWEINEGSQGKFTFNFRDGIINLEHGENYEREVDFEITERIKF